MNWGDGGAELGMECALCEVAAFFSPPFLFVMGGMLNPPREHAKSGGPLIQGLEDRTKLK